MNEQDRMTQRQGVGPGLSPGLTEEETARLLALLAEAYPSPKKDIRAAVTEAIRAEKTKILPVADSRRSRGVRMGRAAKWGALAACLVLVTAVGVRFLPNLTRDLAVADNAAPEMAYDMAVPEEAVEESFEEAAPAAPEMHADAYSGSQMKSAAVPEPVPEPEMARDVYEDAPADAPEESAVVTEDDGTEVCAPMAPMAESAEEPADAADEPAVYNTFETSLFTAEAEADAGSRDDGIEFGASLYADAFSNAWGLNDFEEPKAAGEARLSEVPRMTSPAVNGAHDTGSLAVPYYYVRTECEHAAAYRNAYHDIPPALIAKVGAEAFDAWARDAQFEDPCGVNILAFALRFGLTKEDIYSTGDVWYYYDLPEDLELTEENAAAIEAYYAAGGDPEKMEARGQVYALKTALIREAGLDAYLAWREPIGDTSLRSWTAREGAAALGIGEERLLALAEECGCTNAQLEE